MNLAAIKEFFKGEVSNDPQTLDLYSHDASLFEIRPDAVVFPRDVTDVCFLVHYVNKHKLDNPELSLTARSGGTDMSGGSVNDSIILAFEKYFTSIGKISGDEVSVQSGVFYRDFEPVTLKQQLLLPTYPASRELCMIGGMVANNAGGEKSLVYGKTDRYVKAIKMVCADGQEHIFQPLSGPDLTGKLKEQSFEGDLYRKLHQLLNKNQKIIAKAKPKVSKNSTGYNIWDAWDWNTLDMTKLIVGSQGTLGIITEVTFKLVPAKPLSGMVVVFMPSLNNLAEIINILLPLKPSSMESFDDHTLTFAFRFFYSFRKTLGWKRFIFLGLSFIPVLRKLIRYLPHFPKIVMLVEFEGNNQAEIETKIKAVEESLQPYDVGLQRA